MKISVFGFEVRFSEKVILKSTLSKNEILYRISRNTQKPKISFSIFYPNPKECKAFEGFVTSNEFYIKRIVMRNSMFTARVRGNVTEKVDGAVVEMNFKFHPIAFLSILVYSLLIGIFLIALLYAEAIQSSDIFPYMFLIIMLLVGWIISLYQFNDTRMNSKDILKKILN